MRRLLMIVVGVVVALSLAWHSVNEVWYRGFLPPQIGVAGMLYHGSDFSPLLILVPIRHEACGGAVFRLMPQTVAAIERDGLKFFAEALGERGHRGRKYAPWHETPVSWRTHEWLPLDCMGWSPWRERIRDAAGRPGAYFAIGNGELVVIPDLGIALVTYYH